MSQLIAVRPRGGGQRRPCVVEAGEGQRDGQPERARSWGKGLGTSHRVEGTGQARAALSTLYRSCGASGMGLGRAATLPRPQAQGRLKK